MRCSKCPDPVHGRGLCRTHYERARGMRLIDTTMLDPAPTAAVIAAHLQRGRNLYDLARIVGVHDTALRAIHLAEVTRVRQATAAAVAAAPLPPTTVGTMRRVQAMARLGWPMSQFAAAGGFKPGTLTAARSRGRTHPRLALQIADAYERLSATPGPSQSVTRRAARSGWAPPAAWEGIDLDDPAAVPDFGAPTRGKTRIDLDEVEWLFAGGCPVEEIAARLGVTVESIRKAGWDRRKAA